MRQKHIYIYIYIYAHIKSRLKNVNGLLMGVLLTLMIR
jgi:hypothetical protein